MINQCKWNEHHLWKWHCWECVWLWRYQQLVCRFLLGIWLDFYRRWIVYGKDLLFVVKNLRRCGGRLVSCSFNPYIYPLLKINAVLNTTTRITLGYKKIMKVSDGKIRSMVSQNNLQDLYKDTKNIIPKEPTHYYYSSKSINKEQDTNLPPHLRKFSTTKRRSLPYTIHRR